MWKFLFGTGASPSADRADQRGTGTRGRTSLDELRTLFADELDCRNQQAWLASLTGRRGAAGAAGDRNACRPAGTATG